MNSCLGTAGKISRMFNLCCMFLAVIGSAAAAGVPRCVSVIDFGAMGDGAADDTASIQQALDAVSTSSNSIVRLPAGVYKISSTLHMHDSTTLCGDGARWEDASTRIEIHKPGFAGVRMGHGCGVKGLAFVYPNNRNNAAPQEYPPAILMNGINPAVENIVFDCAWIGISSEPADNVGQALFRDITGFVHAVGLRIYAGRDVSRIQDVHWFVGGNEEPNKSWYRHHRIGFQFGNVDGIILDGCFMIFGETFLEQLRENPGPNPMKPYNHSLGYQVSRCWIEHVHSGFIIRGAAGFVLNNSNILLEKGGTGIRLETDGVFYGGAVSQVQIRNYFDNPVKGIVFAPVAHHMRNRFAIADCQFVGASPAVELGSKAQRVSVHDCHMLQWYKEPVITLGAGSDFISVHDNIFSGLGKPIADMTGTTATKSIRNNMQERISTADKPTTPPAGAITP